LVDRRKILLDISDKETLANVAMSLVQLGFSITGVLSPEEDVKEKFIMTRSELFIQDMREGANLDLSNFKNDTPIIQIIKTDSNPPNSSNHYTHLLYPFTKKDLKDSINRLAIPLEATSSQSDSGPLDPAKSLKLEDRIFVRYKDKMVKLEIADILYIEADSNYSRIFAKETEYLLAITLKTMQAKLPVSSFFRIHRSYIVNLRHIDEVAETHLIIARKALPVSKTLRSSLLKRLQTI